MSILAAIQQNAANVKTEDNDVLGGSKTIPTNVYPATIKMMYLDTAKSGAISVNLEAVMMVNGKQRSHKETVYISNREGKFTYTDKQSGEEHPLPGFSQIDTLCQLALGKPFVTLSAEKKVIKVYDFQARAEVNQEKEVYVDMIGTHIQIGMFEETVNKQKKNDQTGKYEPINESRDQNVINKFFGEDGHTLTEKEAGTEPKFIDAWRAQYAGNEDPKANKINKFKAVKESGAVAGAPAGTGQPGGSLF